MSNVEVEIDSDVEIAEESNFPRIVRYKEATGEIVLTHNLRILPIPALESITRINNVDYIVKSINPDIITEGSLVKACYTIDVLVAITKHNKEFWGK